MATAARTTPLISDLLQIEPDDQQAAQLGAEFLASREAQIQARLARLDAELAESEHLPDALVLERQAADALRALLDLLQPDEKPAPAPASRPAPVLYEEPALPSPRRRGLAIALGLAAAACLIGLAAVAWLLWGRSQPNAGTTPAVTAVAVSPSAPGREQEPRSTRTGVAAATDQPMTPTVSVPPAVATASARLFPTVPGNYTQVEDADRPVELHIPDGAGAGHVQVPLQAMTETIRLDAGVPVLYVEPPSTGAGFYRASVPFGEPGATVIALPLGTADLRSLRPGDLLTGCNSGGACCDYRVTAAESWATARLASILSLWPPDLELLIYTDLDDETAWVVQAQREEK